LNRDVAPRRIKKKLLCERANETSILNGQNKVFIPLKCGEIKRHTLYTGPRRLFYCFSIEGHKTGDENGFKFIAVENKCENES
jgi:hypothetical protein